MSYRLNKSGFTLTQLIIVMSILLILSAAVFIWIDPVARIGTAKNKSRTHDVNIIAAAITDYAGDHKGALPVLGSINTNKKVLCSSQGGSNLSCDGSSQLCLTVDDDFYEYLGKLPHDPDKSSNVDTGYYLQKDSNNNLVVGACATYNSEEIIKKPGINVSCTAYGGGYCWYLGATLNVDCDTICTANNLDCVKNVIYGPDEDNNGTAFCRLNKDLTGDCAGGPCASAGTSTPPYTTDDYADCAIQTGAVTCYTAPGTLKFAICACE